ncbi:aminotransferase class V-fold PLP-dependent enzyme [archaeon]|nr:MAG: aminotransferase class V-fold PLP-dependent enzyme [archaeon]
MKLIGEVFPWSQDSVYVYPSNAHNSLMGMRIYTEQFLCVPQEYLYFHHNEDKAVHEIYNMNIQPVKTHVQCTLPSISHTAHAPLHTHSSDTHPSHTHFQAAHKLTSSPDASSQTPSHTPTYSLLGLPSECNFSGRKLNHHMLPHIHHNIHTHHPTHTFLYMLDAAKVAGTSDVKIKCVCRHRHGYGHTQTHTPGNGYGHDDGTSKPSNNLKCMCMPDFIVLSYYKMFGMPTGLGACIIKNTIHPILHKKYFGGGTIQQGYAYTSWCVPRHAHTHTHYEDGTIHYQGIMMARSGFRFIHKLGGMAAIQHHIHKIWVYMMDKLTQLKHANGVCVCIVYNSGPKHPSTYTSSQQGGVVAFNVCFGDGTPVGHTQVQKAAEKMGIYFRTGIYISYTQSTTCHKTHPHKIRHIPYTIYHRQYNFHHNFLGCFCNLGACHEALGLSCDDVMKQFAQGKVCAGQHNEVLDMMDNKHTGEYMGMY